MKLTATEQTFEFTDPSGYNFTVKATFDPEYGWHAEVRMGTSGLKTCVDAVKHLALSAKEFLRQVKKLEGEK